jgi:UDP-N-acetylglucosamine 2-epimerase
METIKSGWNVLTGTNAKKIVRGVRHLEKGRKYPKTSKIYGDGKSSQRIVNVLGGCFG